MFPPPPQPPIRIKAVSQVRSHSAIPCGGVKPAEDCVPAGGRTVCRHGWTLHWAGRATRPTSDQRSIVSLLQYSLSAVLHLGKPGLQCAGAPVRQSNNSYHFSVCFTLNNPTLQPEWTVNCSEHCSPPARQPRQLCLSLTVSHLRD